MVTTHARPLVLKIALMACVYSSCSTSQDEFKPVCTADDLINFMDMCMSEGGSFTGCTHGTADQISCDDQEADANVPCSISYESPCFTSCQKGEVDGTAVDQNMCRSDEE